MYNREVIEQLTDFIAGMDGNMDKSRMQNAVQQAFGLVKERSVFYCDWFAIRFCKAANRNFSNTVLALSVLHRYDHVPFIVCLVTPSRSYLMLANTTFLKKISHSSQELRRDNIKGSFNGSDIMREFEGVENCPENFEFLYNSHENYTFEENLERWWRRRIRSRLPEKDSCRQMCSWRVSMTRWSGQSRFYIQRNIRS